MTSIPILSRLRPWQQATTWCRQTFAPRARLQPDQPGIDAAAGAIEPVPLTRPSVYHLAQDPAALPRFVQESAVAMRYLNLLGPLAWDRLPERNLEPTWGAPTLPYAPFVAACLVKLDQHLVYMSNLRRFLVEHPPLVWILGFPLTPSGRYAWGFDVDVSLPTQRHFTRLLSRVPNSTLQFLLDNAVGVIRAELPPEIDDFGQTIALDTKHVIAWVKQNNLKDYVDDRYDKTKQPAGDPDCRLGCKRKHNQAKGQSDVESATPTTNPVPAKNLAVGEYYWGYGSGIVVTRVSGWAEIVLAELTQPFDQPDVSYFKPLMADVERRLGCRPRFGAFDAAFDALCARSRAL